jgi:hypothetical protein
MSSASPLRITPSVRPVRSKEILKSLFVEPLRFAGFWSAVALPFVLLSLVVAGAATQRVDLFAGLLGANLVALRLGRNYNRD